MRRSRPAAGNSTAGRTLPMRSFAWKEQALAGLIYSTHRHLARPRARPMALIAAICPRQWLADALGPVMRSCCCTVIRRGAISGARCSRRCSLQGIAASCRIRSASASRKSRPASMPIRSTDTRPIPALSFGTLFDIQTPASWAKLAIGELSNAQAFMIPLRRGMAR